MFTDTQKAQIQKKGISTEKVEGQLKALAKGFPAAHLMKPCTPGDGMVQLSEAQKKSCLETYTQAAGEGRVLKFVPASGAASRMFKALSYAKTCLETKKIDELLAQKDSDGNLKDFFEFLENLERFAFYETLDQQCQKKFKLSAKELVAQKKVKALLEILLTEEGLDFSNLPKGLIPFHHYEGTSRTAFQEHVIEAAQFAKSKADVLKVHFTVPVSYQRDIEKNLEPLQKSYAENGTECELSYSSQKESTDTVAAIESGAPFELEDGTLLFRPGGHGALLENLEEVEGDIVFIKNIDNIVPDRLKEDVCEYKKILGGYLVQLQTKVFDYLKVLSADAEAPLLKEALVFLESSLGIQVPEEIKNAPEEEQSEFILSKLKRPIRVCGMVKNEGEPGGGPFWVKAQNGEVSKQIIESAQVDMNDANQKEIWQSSTHFNPVDLVCGMRDEAGNHYALQEFVDPETGFVAEKSQDGRKLKALELPGLWNGAMAYWNTVFVEVPISTFNPVKTVLDLLRKQHQS